MSTPNATTVYPGAVPAQPTFYEHIGSFTVPVFTAGSTKADTVTAVAPTVNSVSKTNGAGSTTKVYYHVGK